MTSKPEKGERPRILVVDDDEAILDMLRKLLSRAGDVEAAGDGEEAMAMIESGYRPDLIILDWMMPRLDGLGVCARLGKDPETARIPVIMLTAKDAPDDLVTGIEAGVRDYITKPFSSEQLLKRVREELER